MSNSKIVPKLKLSILSLLLCSILAYLGTWQINRAIYKKNIVTQLQQKVNNLPVPLSSLNNPSLITDRFTKVQFEAQFINELTLLLDNQMHNHEVGYRVITVAKSPQLEKWVLIDRGWIARGSNRQSLPKITELTGNIQICGIINTIPTGIVLKKDNLIINENGTFVIQRLDYKLLNTILPHQVFDFVVQLQYTDINFGLSSSKHIGYAVQWYCFALLVLIYYVLATIKKEH